MDFILFIYVIWYFVCFCCGWCKTWFPFSDLFTNFVSICRFQNLLTIARDSRVGRPCSARDRPVFQTLYSRVMNAPLLYHVWPRFQTTRAYPHFNRCSNLIPTRTSRPRMFRGHTTCQQILHIFTAFDHVQKFFPVIQSRYTLKWQCDRAFTRWINPLLN